MKISVVESSSKWDEGSAGKETEGDKSTKGSVARELTFCEREEERGKRVDNETGRENGRGNDTGRNMESV